jgi:hypothetical protein
MERERKRLEQFRQARGVKLGGQQALGSDFYNSTIFASPLDLAARLVIGLHPLTQAR